MIMQCHSCRFNGGTYAQPDRPDEWGLKCVRNPPIATGGMMSSSQTIWPLVQPSDYCGEWKDAQQ